MKFKSRPDLTDVTRNPTARLRLFTGIVCVHRRGPCGSEMMASLLVFTVYCGVGCMAAHIYHTRKTVCLILGWCTSFDCASEKKFSLLFFSSFSSIFR